MESTMDAAKKDSLPPPQLGQRVLIIGSTNAGKSTLGTRLAEDLNLPHVDLDALNWQKDWVGLHQSDPERFREKIRAATAGDSWVVTGNYTNFSQELIWPRVETIIWLDLPLGLLSRRLLRRSRQRWRTRELLWGCNTERFWPQLAIWKEESLLRWLWKTYGTNREKTLAAMGDDQWSHIRFIHLQSPAEVKAFSFGRWTEAQVVALSPSTK
ncbi:hypothetical protein AAFN60_21660 [Roseibacillus persicicus]|uniref:hypothetical protein n=1 Tax=Roseibacillus persicicus TaxID=454148 RepID=UPI00398AEAB0